MKLTVLVDNNTYINQYYLGEPGACYYIEDGSEKILLDTGYSDIAGKNARKMGIDLGGLTKIVFSHGHNDHTGGLQYLKDEYDLSNVEIISHPDTWKAKRFETESIGSSFSEREIEEIGRLHLTKEPMQLSEHLFFLGEIPTVCDFEPRLALGEQKAGEDFCDDYVMDDSALAYRGDDGVFVITGCSHSGICNIIEQAKRVCGTQTVTGVIGGFHLFQVNERVKATIRYFEESGIRQLYPCHCTSFAVRAAIHEKIPVKEVGVGFMLSL